MKIRNDSCHGNSAELFKLSESGFKDSLVSPELVDYRSLNELLFFRFQKFHSAVELCEYSASVDVSCKKHRSVHHPGEAHVHYILVLEIYLSGGPCAFDHDDVVLGSEFVKCLHDVRHQFPLMLVVFHGLHVSHDLTENYYL